MADPATAAHYTALHVATAAASNADLSGNNAQFTATTDQLKAAITHCVDCAIAEHPTVTDSSSAVDERTKTFASMLSGFLESMGERELAEKIFTLFKRS
ncbi:hypothetical protein [Herminiimonas sp. CN]|uniref:hypothetical protein n=1 Tax=Herminiimonas sp. CN TaxID=1349818 RepID=UPI000473A714|nr:hypothetical protein [Herminiimonas sp. CN]